MIKAMYTHRQILNNGEENELAKYLITSVNHAFSPGHTRQLAYQWDVRNGKDIQNEWTRCKEAGEDWTTGFPQRIPTHTLRKPNAFSLNRAVCSIRCACPQAFVPQTIQSGFRVSGCYPFNKDIFMDDEYLTYFVIDQPEEVPLSTAARTSSRSAAKTSSHSACHSKTI